MAETERLTGDPVKKQVDALWVEIQREVEKVKRGEKAQFSDGNLESLRVDLLLISGTQPELEWRGERALELCHELMEGEVPRAWRSVEVPVREHAYAPGFATEGDFLVEAQRRWTKIGDISYPQGFPEERWAKIERELLSEPIPEREVKPPRQQARKEKKGRKDKGHMTLPTKTEQPTGEVVENPYPMPWKEIPAKINADNCSRWRSYHATQPDPQLEYTGGAILEGRRTGQLPRDVYTAWELYCLGLCWATFSGGKKKKCPHGPGKCTWRHWWFEPRELEWLPEGFVKACLASFTGDEHPPDHPQAGYKGIPRYMRDGTTAVVQSPSVEEYMAAAPEAKRNRWNEGSGNNLFPKNVPGPSRPKQQEAQSSAPSAKSEASDVKVAPAGRSARDFLQAIGGVQDWAESADDREYRQMSKEEWDAEYANLFPTTTLGPLPKTVGSGDAAGSFVPAYPGDDAGRGAGFSRGRGFGRGRGGGSGSWRGHGRGRGNMAFGGGKEASLGDYIHQW